MQAVSYRKNTTAMLETPFTFSSASPIVLAHLHPGNVMTRAVIVIETPFNDPAAKVLLGTTANPSLYLGAADSDPLVSGQYGSEEVIDLNVPDYLILTVQPSASSQGAGRLYYEMR